MHELLDDSYSLEDSHNQEAPNGLMQFPEIQEELIWTGRPIYLSFSERLLSIIGYFAAMLVLFVCTALFLLSAHPFRIVFLLIVAMYVLFILTPIFKGNEKRFQTFYGIGPAHVWIKEPETPLACFAIKDLARLSVRGNTIIYTTVVNSDYEVHELLQHVRDAPSILRLLVDIQEKKAASN